MKRRTFRGVQEMIQISLSKMSPKQLDKHLNLIYNISRNTQKKYIITSIKTVF